VVVAAKVVVLVLHRDTLVPLGVAVVLELLGRVLEIEPFLLEQETILDLQIRCLIRDSLVELVELLVDSITLAVAVVLVEQVVMEIQTHYLAEALVDQVKRIHLLLLLLLHQRYLHQLEQDLQQM
tara:strand:+ start:240 stop:614 length:375 start_codon:yes stop_codon:yes gene_type:complete